MATPVKRQKAQHANLRDYDHELRDRLALIKVTIPQAEIARRTGTARGNVFRYLNGTKMPADFLCALVDKLGVNPNWLHLGEGTPFLTDVGSTTAESASDMLEMVQAMNAALKLRFGAIAGQDRVKVLRKLDESIRLHNDYQTKLDERLRPLFDSLLTDLDKNIASQNITVTRPAYESAVQVAGLCRDAALQKRFLQLKGQYLSLAGDLNGAVACENYRILAEFEQAGHITDDILGAAGANVAALASMGRLREARRIGRAMLSLGEECHDQPSYHALVCTVASVEANLGNMRRGASLMMRSFHRLPEQRQKALYPICAEVLTISGAVSLGAILASDQDWLERHPNVNTNGSAYAALHLFTWSEDVALLRRAQKIHESRFVDGVDVYMWYIKPYVDALVAVLGGGSGRKAIASMDRDSRLCAVRDSKRRPLVAALVRAGFAHVAERAGDTQRARAESLEAERLIADAPPRVRTLQGSFRFVNHYRTVLRVFSENDKAAEVQDARTRARRFFRRLARGGCELYQDWKQSATRPRPQAAGGGA